MHPLTTRRSGLYLRFGLICLLLFQMGCATITQQRESQEIRVTSNPSGAQIFLNDEPVTVTPAKIVLIRKRTNSLRVQKVGYAPYELTMSRGYSRAGFLGNLFGAALFGWFNYSFLYLIGQNDRNTSFFTQNILGHDSEKGRTSLTFVAPLVYLTGLSIGIDRLTGAGFRQRPSQINANLMKSDNAARE